MESTSTSPSTSTLAVEVKVKVEVKVEVNVNVTSAPLFDACSLAAARIRGGVRNGIVRVVGGAQVPEVLVAGSVPMLVS